jgi:hypothetical protein
MSIEKLFPGLKSQVCPPNALLRPDFPAYLSHFWIKPVPSSENRWPFHKTCGKAFFGRAEIRADFKAWIATSCFEARKWIKTD